MKYNFFFINKGSNTCVDHKNIFSYVFRAVNDVRLTWADVAAHKLVAIDMQDLVMGSSLLTWGRIRQIIFMPF